MRDLIYPSLQINHECEDSSLTQLKSHKVELWKSLEVKMELINP